MKKIKGKIKGYVEEREEINKVYKAAKTEAKAAYQVEKKKEMIKQARKQAKEDVINPLNKRVGKLLKKGLVQGSKNIVSGIKELQKAQGGNMMSAGSNTQSKKPEVQNTINLGINLDHLTEPPKKVKGRYDHLL